MYVCTHVSELVYCKTDDHIGNVYMLLLFRTSFLKLYVEFWC